MIIVNYEVYVLEQSRGWMLHARFPRQERETALEEAKELERTLKVRVKVIRETYYTDDNLFEEAEVYISGGAKPAPPRTTTRQSGARPSGGQSSSPGGRKSPGTQARAAASKAKPTKTKSPRKAASAQVSAASFDTSTLDFEERPRKRKAAKARHLLGRLLIITAFALAAAFGSIKVMPSVIMFLWEQGFRIDISPNAYGQLLFAVFVLTFLITAVPLAIRFLPRQTEIPIIRRPHWNTSPKPDKELRKSLDKLASEALAQLPSIPVEEDQDPDPLPPLADEEVLPEILPGPDEELPPILPDPIEAGAEEWGSAEATVPASIVEPQPEPEPQQSWADQPQEPEKPQKPQKESAFTVEAVQPSVMRFLNGAVNSIKAAVPVLDSYNKFALHLYMAGGIESLCEFRKMGEGAKVKLTTMALETLGTKAEIAVKFHEKLDEYGLEPRYLGVLQAGRDAMGDFLVGDETNAHYRIKDMMKTWNKPAETGASIMTVMFTDMVGSTDLTQARGDAAAQEIVRSHNSIVRGALAQYSGKEIKHTGDGIMASFASAANAVEATVSIQRQVAAKNKRTPDFGLHLRIGLNAGEPIQEEDDLFGATVQLAARVCAATLTDQTLCTGVVKDLSHGKGGLFRPMGNHTLKGFRDPVPLFEIPWKE